MEKSAHIVDVTADNFEAIIAASFEVPLLMDFWAGWCQPCHMLMPILAKLAEESDGTFLLGKLDTEAEPDIAARFGIRSLPTVKLFRDGEVVDEFMGALPESAVREFLAPHIARASDGDVERARKLAADGKPAEAIDLLSDISANDPDNVRASFALAEILADSGDVEAAIARLDALPANEAGGPEAIALRNRLYFDAELAGAPDRAELEAAVEADPRNADAMYKLALREVTDGNYEAAMELLLALMQTDRGYGEDAGRRALLKVFELLGDDPRVGRYRGRMASLLY